MSKGEEWRSGAREKEKRDEREKKINSSAFKHIVKDYFGPQSYLVD